MKKQKLEIGQDYKVTARFADAVGASYLTDKIIIYRGLVTSTQHNPWEGDVEIEIEKHLFQVKDSDEKIWCDKKTSMQALFRLFD